MKRISLVRGIAQRYTRQVLQPNWQKEEVREEWKATRARE